jgi:hypothetical protein
MLGQTKTFRAHFGAAALAALIIVQSSAAMADCSLVTIPNGSSSANNLLAVTAISSTDAWTVGEDLPADTFLPLAEHWNGTNWTVIPTATLTANGELGGVTALSSTNVWAVGSAYANGSPSVTLTEHWNGTAWKKVASPNTNTGANQLNAVGHGGGAIWAVGTAADSVGDTFTLTERRSASAWTIIPSPDVANAKTYLDGVAVISPTDAWAVGHWFSSHTGLTGTFVIHWNGSAWSQVADASGPALTSLQAVSAKSATDVWASGWSFANSTFSTFVEHWNGTKWSVVRPAAVANTESFGIAALGSGHARSAGIANLGGGANGTFVEGGPPWATIKSANPGSTQWFNAASAIPGVSSAIWVVGQYNNDFTLAEYCP